MKILLMAESIVGLFPKKVSVTLIHAEKGNTIGSYKMSREQLPEIFNKPTILDLGDQSWRITKAIPFQIDGAKKLTLHVTSSKDIGSRFMVPTKSFPAPTLTEVIPDDYTIEIGFDDWRQLELLPVSQLELIQEEIIIVEGMLEALKEDEGLLGYETIHERIRIEDAYLNIPFDEFYQFVNGIEKGSVAFVQNSFVIRSENYNYYGIVKDGLIRNICLQQFDCADDEFSGVVEKYDLLLADWCSGKIIF